MSSECYTKYLPDDRKIHVEFFKNLNQNYILESPASNRYSYQNIWWPGILKEFWLEWNFDQKCSYFHYQMTTELS